jgi:hypothetical protein
MRALQLQLEPKNVGEAQAAKKEIEVTFAAVVIHDTTYMMR